MRDLRRRVIAATLEAAAKRGDRERIAYDEEADAAIAVVLEEAAKVVDGYHKVHTYTRDIMDNGNRTTHTGRTMADPLKMAAAIRALKE